MVFFFKKKKKRKEILLFKTQPCFLSRSETLTSNIKVLTTLRRLRRDKFQHERLQKTSRQSNVLLND